jgi:hypothetical protein
MRDQRRDEDVPQRRRQLVARARRDEQPGAGDPSLQLLPAVASPNVSTHSSTPLASIIVSRLDMAL